MGRVVSVVVTGLLLAHAFAVPAIAAPTYFLVAEPHGARVHGDSYVLPLEQVSDITHARDLIARGREAGSPIVFAEIVKSSNARNRDLLSPEQPAWSWHVKSFNGFGDFGIELLDSWPTYVEQNLDEWIRATGEVVDPKRGAPTGNIGFWNYTVVHPPARRARHWPAHDGPRGHRLRHHESSLATRTLIVPSRVRSTQQRRYLPLAPCPSILGPRPCWS
jgi:hypothetical protein